MCDLAVGNTYYMQAMLNNPEQKAWADAVKILFPNAADRGTHVNVSGASLAAHAPNRANAEKLMEFLVTPEAQELYAHKNGEYPVVPGVEPSDLVKSWGTLKPDPLPLDKVAQLPQEGLRAHRQGALRRRPKLLTLERRTKFRLGPAGPRLPDARRRPPTLVCSVYCYPAVP